MASSRWWESEESRDKRRQTFARKKVRKGEVAALRTMRRHVPSVEDAVACMAWLQAKGVNLADPDMPQRQRLNWVRKAKKAMVDTSRALAAESPANFDPPDEE